MQTAILLATLVALIWKLTDGVKVVMPKLPDLAIQGVALTLGVIVAYLVWVSDLSSAIQIGDWNFDKVNGWTVIIVGLALGSSSSASFDIKEAIGTTKLINTTPAVPLSKEDIQSPPGV